MTIIIIRGSYANEFELQNYAPLSKKFNISAITSKSSLTKLSLNSHMLKSPADLSFPYKKQILNRLIGGEHWLSGLEKIIESGALLHTAETYYPYTHQAVQLRKKRAINRLVCTCWETIPHANEKFTRIKKWKQEAYLYVDIFHTPTERAKQALVTEGVSPKKIRVIPYGVDLKRFHPHTHRKNKRPLILTVARLEKEKGMEDLELVAARLPQADFLVIGSGAYHPRGENITIKNVPYEEIHKEYQRADLFFLPSRTTSTWEEQYGMALVEAMACALPVVSTVSGAIPEVVGEAGVLVPERDSEAATHAILAILNNPKKAQGLSTRSLGRAISRYDRDKVATKLAQLYT